MDYPKLLISGSYNVFNESWNGAGIYMCSGLYQSNTFKQPIYVGSANDLQKRIEWGHISHLNRNCHLHNPPLQNAWNKHGQENFVWYLIESCEPEKTLEREQVYLDLYHPFVDEFGGFNISHETNSPGARFGSNNGFYGKKHTEETRKKMSENHADFRGKKSANFGRKRTKEEIEKSIKTLKKNYKNGKIIHWRKGKIGTYSQESINKMIQKKKGIRVSIKSEFKKGMIPWNSGKVHSVETRKNISEALKNSNKCKEAAKIKRKKVICIETGIIYESITDAGQKTNLKSISKVINGRVKTCGGYHWAFVK